MDGNVTRFEPRPSAERKLPLDWINKGPDDYTHIGSRAHGQTVCGHSVPPGDAMPIDLATLLAPPPDLCPGCLETLVIGWLQWMNGVNPREVTMNTANDNFTVYAPV